MRNHTPAPWYVIDTEPGCDVAASIEGSTGYVVADIPAGPNGEKPTGYAEDAARIVACVNACEGIDDPAAVLNDARALLSDLTERVSHHGDPQYGETYAARLTGGDILRIREVLALLS